MGPLAGYRGDELRTGSSLTVAIFGASCGLGRAASRPLGGSIAADDNSRGGCAASGCEDGVGGARASFGCLSACSGSRRMLRARRNERCGCGKGDTVV